MVTTITARDKQLCAEREVAIRRRVYPRWVARGQMTQGDAEREIAIMETIAADYRSAADLLTGTKP